MNDDTTSTTDTPLDDTLDAALDDALDAVAGGATVVPFPSGDATPARTTNDRSRRRTRRSRVLQSVELGHAELVPWAEALVARIRLGQEPNRAWSITVRDAPGPVDAQSMDAYLRLSRDSQRNASDEDEAAKKSLVIQLKRVLDLAEQGQLRLTQVWIDSDSAFRGNSNASKRAAMGAMRRALAADKIQVLCVREVGRLFRDMVAGSAFYQECQDRGVRVVSLKEGLGGTGNGRLERLLAAIMFWAAEEESESTSFRQKEKKNDLADAGLWAGGMLPIGHKPVRVADGVTLELEPAEAAAIVEGVRRILEEAAPYSVVAKLLAEVGVESVSGAPLAGSSLMYLLRSPRLCGYRVKGQDGLDLLTDWKGRLKRCVLDEATGAPREAYPPILDRATWVRLNTELDARAAKRTRRVARGMAELSGVLECAHCGTTMAASGGPGSRTYVCFAKYRSPDKGCPGNAVRAGAVEEALFADLLTRVTPENLLAAQQAAAVEDARLNTPSPNAAEIARLTGELDELELLKELGTFEGPTGTKRYSVKFRELTRALDELTAAQEVALSAPKFDGLVGIDLAAEWGHWSPADRNTAFRLVYERVTLAKAQVLPRTGKGHRVPPQRTPVGERLTIVARIPPLLTLPA